MKLCYKCFSEKGLKGWERLDCDDYVAEECDVCGLKGIYVREVK